MLWGLSLGFQNQCCSLLVLRPELPCGNDLSPLDELEFSHCRSEVTGAELRNGYGFGQMEKPVLKRLEL